MSTSCHHVSPRIADADTWRRRGKIILALEDLMRAVEKTPRVETVSRRDRAYAVCASACSDWKAHFKARYEKISGLSRIGATGHNEHIRDGADADRPRCTRC